MLLMNLAKKNGLENKLISLDYEQDLTNIKGVGFHIALQIGKKKNIRGRYRVEVAYWITFLTFLYCSPFSYRSSNFAIAKVVALIWAQKKR